LPSAKPYPVIKRQSESSPGQASEEIVKKIAREIARTAEERGVVVMGTCKPCLRQTKNMHARAATIVDFIMNFARLCMIFSGLPSPADLPSPKRSRFGFAQAGAGS
jgi:hypothetical protein